MERRTINMNKFINFTLIVFFVGAIMLGFQNCSNSMKPLNLDEESNAGLSISQLEFETMALLERKCTACHNADLNKGNISYITNLPALRFHRIVVDKLPSFSPLYTVFSVNEEHMTLVDQKEIEMIHKWISEGMSKATQMQPTWSSIQLHLVERYQCTNCHSTAGNRVPPRGLDLSSYTTLMRSTVINTADPASSRILLRLSSTDPGFRMPFNGPIVSTSDIDVIKQWIEAGAPNN